VVKGLHHIVKRIPHVTIAKTIPQARTTGRTLRLKTIFCPLIRLRRATSILRYALVLRGLLRGVTTGSVKHKSISSRRCTLTHRTRHPAWIIRTTMGTPPVVATRTSSLLVDTTAAECLPLAITRILTLDNMEDLAGVIR
jgi:hypothetical protein